MNKKMILRVYLAIFILLGLISCTLTEPQENEKPSSPDKLKPEINVKIEGIDIQNGTLNYDIGSIEFGSILDITFVIENTGKNNLVLKNEPCINISGAMFALKTDAAKTIESNGSVSFIVTFQPTDINSYTCNIIIENNDLDEGLYSFSISGKCVENPIPQNVSASDGEAGDFTDRIRITWDEIPKATKYLVYRADSEFSNYFLIGETDSNIYDDFKVINNVDILKIGVSYYYKVQAV